MLIANRPDGLPCVLLLATAIGSTKKQNSGSRSLVPAHRFMMVTNLRFAESGRVFLTSRPIQRSIRSLISFSEVQATIVFSCWKKEMSLPSTLKDSSSKPSSLTAAFGSISLIKSFSLRISRPRSMTRSIAPSSLFRSMMIMYSGFLRRGAITVKVTSPPGSDVRSENSRPTSSFLLS